MSDGLLAELALARKTRSPTYQERYLWVPLEINAGLGDGNNYIGDPALEPERSRQIEIGFDWELDRLRLSPRLFRHDIDGYIQGVPATGMAAVGVSRNANGDPTPLLFANTAARIEGLDLTLDYRIDERWRLEAVAAAVDGARRDTDDSLYRISPDSLRLALHYETGRFLARFEQLLVAEQDAVSRANTLDPANPNNSHAATDGHSLTNVCAALGPARRSEPFGRRREPAGRGLRGPSHRLQPGSRRRGSPRRPAVRPRTQPVRAAAVPLVTARGGA